MELWLVLQILLTLFPLKHLALKRADKLEQGCLSVSAAAQEASGALTVSFWHELLSSVCV